MFCFYQLSAFKVLQIRSVTKSVSQNILIMEPNPNLQKNVKSLSHLNFTFQKKIENDIVNQYNIQQILSRRLSYF